MNGEIKFEYTIKTDTYIHFKCAYCIRVLPTVSVTRSAKARFKRNRLGAVRMYELVSIMRQVKPFPGMPTKRRTA